MNQVKNIIHFYRKAGKFYGVNWYEEAYQFAVNLSEQFKKPVIQTAGILSALSPLKSWQENKRIANANIKNCALRALLSDRSIKFLQPPVNPNEA